MWDERLQMWDHRGPMWDYRLSMGRYVGEAMPKATRDNEVYLDRGVDGPGRRDLSS